MLVIQQLVHLRIKRRYLKAYKDLARGGKYTTVLHLEIKRQNFF